MSEGRNVKERNCRNCGTTCTEACPKCLKQFESRRPAGEMDVEARVSELRTYMHSVEIPLDLVMQRVQELMQRQVFSHEVACPEELYAEIRRGTHASAAEVLGKVPEEKLLACVKLDG